MSVSCSFSSLAWIASGVTWCAPFIWSSLWVACLWGSVLCSWNKAQPLCLVRDEEASLDWVLFFLNIDFSMWKHPHCWILRASDLQQLILDWFLRQNSDSRSVLFFLIPVMALCSFYEVLHSIFSMKTTVPFWFLCFWWYNTDTCLPMLAQFGHQNEQYFKWAFLLSMWDRR